MLRNLLKNYIETLTFPRLEEDFDHYCKNFDKVLKDIPSESIVNYGETNPSDDPKQDSEQIQNYQREVVLA